MRTGGRQLRVLTRASDGEVESLCLRVQQRDRGRVVEAFTGLWMFGGQALEEGLEEGHEVLVVKSTEPPLCSPQGPVGTTP